MNPFIQAFSTLPQIRAISEGIYNKDTPLGLKESGPSLCPLLSYVLAESTGKNLLLISHSNTSALFLYQKLLPFYKKDLVFLPSRELILFDAYAFDKQSRIDRLKALYRIGKNDFRAIVTSVEALTLKTTSKERFLQSVITLKEGQNYEMEDILKKLSDIGYERRDMVESPGHYSSRGSIIDIFSPNMDNPIRVDFFGDEIDSIRFFDIDNQRSIKNQKEIEIIPFSELLINSKEEKILESIIEDPEDLYHLRSGQFERLRDRYFSYLEDAQISASYLDKELLTVLHDDTKAFNNSSMLYKEYSQLCINLLGKKKTHPKACSMQDSIFALLPLIDIDLVFSYTESDYSLKVKNTLKMDFEALPSYKGDIDQLMNDVVSYMEKRIFVFLITDSKKKSDFVHNLFTDSGIEVSLYQEGQDYTIYPGRAYIIENGYNESFLSKEANVVSISISKVFQKIERKRKRQIQDSDFFAQIEMDDYVVHEYHGIGIYKGIEKIEIEKIIKDYIKIEYKNQDMLYVPVSKMDLIQKYVGSGEGKPKLYGLGGKEWERQKNKVKSAVKDIAKDLIDLYGQRSSIKGFVFPPDDAWQISFENEFEFEETNDQIRSVQEIKEDMESSKVMDRLLCGDVGYGKTEVALRAAFKAVMGGKQVAFLAPTTMLALQHYQNFVERMKNFPVKVEMLSRLKDTKSQYAIIDKAKKGEIDILVGTHRILGKDVKFKNLGLLVVDEEQRFGVAQKENIKILRPQIDVLTLSATPIPRTMHMALTGIRDVSTIYDPPEKRLPVQTFVMEYDSEFLKQVILREKSRKGQIFYLYNRVRDMETKFHFLKEEFGDSLSIGMAHGQMAKKEFEENIIKFLNREYDLLLCTTIIEAGIDIPNANTLIVEDADRLGLAQLYQIKGRVGRSDRSSYAYLTYKKDKQINEDAQKRLDTIKEFTDFGSGLKIAMKDLEIRGGGDLLGAAQSGFMQGVGYEMFVRILSQAIAQVRGEKPKDSISEALVDLNISAFIDQDYIVNNLTRLKIYKRISLVESKQEKYDIIDELIDRFGEPPQEVLNILDIAYAKNLASKLGIDEIGQIEKGFYLTFKSERLERLNDLLQTLDDLGEKHTLKSREMIKIEVLSTKKGTEILDQIIEILKKTYEIVAKEQAKGLDIK